MDYNKLIPRGFELARCRFGRPQRSGAMTVVPIFSTDHNGRFAYPRTGLKLSQVRGYGNMELTNPSASGVAIVPLHMGYIQDKAQNHALCRSAFIGAGQKLMFEDACCVQAGQGGYLEEREQWFFILPLQLREEALKLRAQVDYSKLWNAISALNTRYGLANRGHLEQIVSNQRAYLTQYQSRFELMPGQTGALFFIKEKLAGVEIAPSAGYFSEVWMPLVCFCYGVAAMYEEQYSGWQPPAIAPFTANSLDGLKAELEQRRNQREERLGANLAQVPAEKFEKIEAERFLGLRLNTLLGGNFAGQYVEEEGELIYASIFARNSYLYN